MCKSGETNRKTWKERGREGGVDEESASKWTRRVRGSHGCRATLLQWWIMGLWAIFSPCCHVWGAFFCCTLRPFLQLRGAWLTVILILFMNGRNDHLDSAESHTTTHTHAYSSLLDYFSLQYHLLHPFFAPVLLLPYHHWQTFHTFENTKIKFERAFVELKMNVAEAGDDSDTESSCKTHFCVWVIFGIGCIHLGLTRWLNQPF